MHGEANQVNITNPNAFRPANNEVRHFAWAGHNLRWKFYLRKKSKILQNFI